MQKLRIIFQDNDLVVIDKPAGLLVHPPEDASIRRFSSNHPNVIRILREQIGQKVFIVHRLDRATSGVMVVALSSEMAGSLQALFQSEQISKTYFALVRGFTLDEGVIDTPLSKDDLGEVEQEASTQFETAFRFELPIATGKYLRSRYSMVKVVPKTGRYHQIRRHFKRESHPLIGDSIHGDGKQNKIWRELTQDSMLYLKAYSLAFTHPKTGDAHAFRSRWGGAWQKVFDQAGICPLF